MGLRRYLQTRGIVRTPISLAPEDVHRVLRTERRRRLIKAIDEHERDDQIQVAELARAVATEESGAESAGVGSDAYETVYTSLYQQHIPLLDGLDVVDWDAEAGVVDATSSIPGIVEVIEEVNQRCE